MLADLDLNSIADDRARELVRQLLNLLEDVMADLRVASTQRTNVCATRSTGSRASRAGPRSSRTSHSRPARTTRNTNGVNPRRGQRPQDGPYFHRPGTGRAGRSRLLATGCPVQGVRGCGGAGRRFRTDNVLFHKEKLVFPVAASFIRRSPTRLQGTVWTWDQAWRWCSTM